MEMLDDDDTLVFYVINKEELCGFALATFIETYIYIYIICTIPNKKIGSRLMNFIELFGLSTRKNAIILHALPEVVGFYKKLGYEGTFEMVKYLNCPE